MSKRPSTADREQSVTESGDGEPFLNRWARRKRVARAGGDAVTAVGESPTEGQKTTDAALASADAPTSPGMDGSIAGDDSQAPELTDEDMPPLDGIDENSDMSGFFSPKVTQAVKKAALRKFFHSPVFNIVDGLDDYDEDFRNFAALGDIVTSDMRGMMEREAERAREAVAKDGGDTEVAAPADARAGEAEQTEKAEKADGEDEPLQIADEDSTGEQMAAVEPGVIREPGRQAGLAGGKLWPRDARAGESRDGRGWAKQDARADEDQ